MRHSREWKGDRADSLANSGERRHRLLRVGQTYLHPEGIIFKIKAIKPFSLSMAEGADKHPFTLL